MMNFENAQICAGEEQRREDTISRQAAYDTLTEYYHHTTETQHKSLKEAMNRVPPIDAVPVVRCKDCRWKVEEQPGMVYCPAVVGGWVDEDWFCKGGERSEDGET